MLSGFCVIRCLKHTNQYKGQHYHFVTLCYQGFVLSGALNIQNARGMNITLCYQDFVLSGALNMQNQCKGHEYHFVLSGFLC